MIVLKTNIIIITKKEEFIKFSKNNPDIFEFLEMHSINLVQIVLIVSITCFSKFKKISHHNFICELKNISGALPRHLVDLLAGILHVFIKEHPQLTSKLLNQILIKSDFQPIAINIQPPSQSQQQQHQPSPVSLTKEQKAAFIRSLLRFVFFTLTI